ncbi:MAG: permease, partial [Halorientalis sp.]
MDRRDYLILAGIAVLVIVVGALTTTKPLGQFLVSGASEAAYTAVAMAWITWWALVIGFAIAGGVEAWVSNESIADNLDGYGFRALGLGAFFGFVSSSCSYSAIATAKNLFKKGASAGASLGAFMFSSTNLVIEIGFVMWLLLGWQFVLADFLGGLILIVLMAGTFRYLVSDDVIEAAREHVQGESDTVRDPNCGMEVHPDETEYSKTVDVQTYYFCSESCMTGWDAEEANTTLTEKMTSLKGWRDLADKQWKEWDMLWDEIAIGFVFAGIVAGFVPKSLWHAVFGGPILGMPTYVVWTAVLGAVIGMITFVCSVGNVPFGTILWTNGLPFGSVLSYIYADLIIPPIMEAYDEYYGARFAAILSGTIFVAAVVTGVLMHFVFSPLGLIPPRSAAHVASISIELNYKAVLNVLAAVLFVVLYWLHKTTRFDDAAGHEGHDHS